MWNIKHKSINFKNFCIFFLLIIINLNIQTFAKSVPPVPTVNEYNQQILNVQDSPATNDILEKPVNGNVLKYSYNYAYKDYYIDSLYDKNRTWSKFPVTIYLENIPHKYASAVTIAINKWNEYIPLEISSSSNSDIIIMMTSKLPVISDDTEYIAGTTQHLYSNNTHKCIIKIIKKKAIPQTQVQEIALHEIGHAIGLEHSPNKNDVMFRQSIFQKGGFSKWSFITIGNIPLIIPSGYKKYVPGNTTISPRDANTLLRSYSDINISDNNDYQNIHNNIPVVNQNNSIYYNNHGNYYYNHDQYDQAIICYQKAVDINQFNTHAYINMGNCYINTGKYNLAINSIKKAISINPNNANAYLTIGIAYYNKGLYNDALYNYNRVISINPNMFAAYINLSSIYNQTGKYDMAIDACNRALSINPNVAMAYNNLGCAYQGKGLHKLAFENFYKALDIDPNLEETKNNVMSLKRFLKVK